MVNETNKPQDALDNEQLENRLAASNQALADMQAEHRQLLEEMEQLRKRAEALQRLREQQEREDEEKRQQYEQSIAAATESLQTLENLENSQEEKKKENDEEEEATPEEADYIKEKLEEIARLKAQFKRVQHMINTTELIENHISKHEAAEKPSGSSQPEITKPKPAAKPAAVAPTPAPLPSLPFNIQLPTPVELPTMPDMPTVADLEAATTSDEKEQLILTMLNMFQDFSSDLRSQADNLRAERERIKELKESIIRSRREPPK